MSHVRKYLDETAEIAISINANHIEALVGELADLKRRHGRLFIIGLGGSAANASHAVNDFRKLCAIDAFCATDNAALLTAIANDEGWEVMFSRWLMGMNPHRKDALLVFSVGGGTDEVSLPLKFAINVATSRRMRVLGVVGRSGGHTAEHGDTVVIVPTVEALRVTPHTQAFQSVILHCLVSHPQLQSAPTKW